MICFFWSGTAELQKCKVRLSLLHSRWHRGFIGNTDRLLNEYKPRVWLNFPLKIQITYNTCFAVFIGTKPTLSSSLWASKRIISLHFSERRNDDMYFSSSIRFSSSHGNSLKSEHAWNHLIFISQSSLLIFYLCSCHAFLTNPLSWLCDVLPRTSKGLSLCSFFFLSLAHSWAFLSLLCVWLYYPDGEMCVSQPESEWMFERKRERKKEDRYCLF